MFEGLKNKLFGKSMDIKSIVDKGGVFLDVRTPEEFAEGHIVGAQHIPLQELPLRINELPKDVPLMVYCKAGVRSGQAQQFLEQNGYEAYNVGGFVSLRDRLDS